MAAILQSGLDVVSANAPHQAERETLMTIVRPAQLRLCTGILALALVGATATEVRAATASWTPNTEPNLAGYKLSYGTQSGVHTVVIDVGKVTAYQFNPPAGRRYYVVVQAYNTAGQLGAKSAEAVVDVPVAEPAAGTRSTRQSDHHG